MREKMVSYFKIPLEIHGNDQKAKLSYYLFLHTSLYRNPWQQIERNVSARCWQKADP